MTTKKIRYYEDQYVAEVNINDAPAGGMKSQDIELAHTCELFDAAGVYRPDPLPDVIRRGAAFLEDKIANGEISALDVFSFTVRKTALRSI
jgi:hypothetical protein